MYACTDIYRHIYIYTYTTELLCFTTKLTEASKSTIPQVLKKKMKWWRGWWDTKPNQGLVTLLPIGCQTFADILKYNRTLEEQLYTTSDIQKGSSKVCTGEVTF